MFQSDLCDYSDAFKNNALFISFISKINSVLIENDIWFYVELLQRLT